MSLVTGFSTKIGGSIDQLADKWISANAIPASQWSGTLSSLNTYIAQSSQQCGNWIHQSVFLYNKGNATSACQQKLQSRYREQLLTRQATEEKSVDTFRNLAFNSNKTLYITIAVVILVLILLYLIS